MWNAIESLLLLVALIQASGFNFFYEYPLQTFFGMTTATYSIARIVCFTHHTRAIKFSLHFRVAARRSYRWEPLYYCFSTAQQNWVATLLLLLRNSQIKSWGKAIHRTQNARNRKLTGLMNAWNEYDAITCMKELCCEKLEKAHEN